MTCFYTGDLNINMLGSYYFIHSILNVLLNYVYICGEITFAGPKEIDLLSSLNFMLLEIILKTHN